MNLYEEEYFRNLFVAKSSIVSEVLYKYEGISDDEIKNVMPKLEPLIEEDIQYNIENSKLERTNRVKSAGAEFYLYVEKNFSTNYDKYAYTFKANSMVENYIVNQFPLEKYFSNTDPHKRDEYYLEQKRNLSTVIILLPSNR